MTNVPIEVRPVVIIAVIDGYAEIMILILAWNGHLYDLVQEALLAVMAGAMMMKGQIGIVQMEIVVITANIVQVVSQTLANVLKVRAAMDIIIGLPRGFVVLISKPSMVVLGVRLTERMSAKGHEPD